MSREEFPREWSVSSTTVVELNLVVKKNPKIGIQMEKNLLCFSLIFCLLRSAVCDRIPARKSLLRNGLFHIQWKKLWKSALTIPSVE